MATDIGNDNCHFQGKEWCLQMMFALWLLQATPEGASDNTTIIRVVAGVLALVCVAVILVRRKRKASKEDWS